MAKKKETKQEPIEKQLWKAADKLRKNIDAAEYKHIVLGLIFLKYISDSFEELYAKLQAGKGEYAGADPEDRDEYRAENVFFVPPSARWSYLQGRAKLPEIGKDIDNAMDAIERDNASLKGVLPKEFAKENLDPTSLGQLIDLISNIALGDEVSRSQDVLGKVYEYFLGEFALAEGKKGGQFYTPESIVKLLVEMLQPYKGRVFDPCCGSGGMFVQSEKFTLSHQGKINDISIYGQESNQTTWRLAKMNLAIRGIDSSQVKWNNEGSFLNNAHKDLKADYIIANPPFNDSDWGGNLMRNDARWKYGTPPDKNANFGWVQHFLYHMTPNGKAGFVLANGSLTSNTGSEGEIRQKLINNDLVECIISLPDKLFYSTHIPASLWFLNKNKQQRKGEILLIDARKLGSLRNKNLRALSPDENQTLINTFQNWKNNDENYSDIEGFCISISEEEIKEKDYELNPGYYVGVEENTLDEALIDNKIIDLKENIDKWIEEEKEINNEISDIVENITLEKVEKSEYKLGDFFTLKGGASFKSKDFKSKGYPVIKIKNVKARRLLLDNIDFISKETSDQFQNYKIKNNDLLITMTGNRFEGGKDSWVGKVAMFKENKDYYLNQRVGILKLKEEVDIDLNYVYYLISNDYYQELFVKIARGSGGQSNLSPTQILSTKIMLPSYDDQVKFSAIIKAIDRKKYINKVINSYLTESNKAIFQKSRV